MTSEQTKELEYIYQLKQTYKRIKKEHYPLCKDKDFTFGCGGCQANRFVKDFENYIDGVESLYKWSYEKPKRNNKKNLG